MKAIILVLVLVLAFAGCAVPIESNSLIADAGRADVVDAAHDCSCEQRTIAGWQWCFVCSSLACAQSNETIAAHDCALSAHENADGSYRCCLTEPP